MKTHCDCYQSEARSTVTSVRFAQLVEAWRPIHFRNGVSESGEVVLVRLTEEGPGAGQMHSKRILSIQRRAKRRLFFMAIVGTAFVGYSALALFAQDSEAGQKAITKMSTTPGVKAVGIRLISSTTNSKNAAPPSSSSASVPSLLLPPPQALPSAFDLPPLPKTGADFPISTAEAAAKLPATGFSSLPVPPRMSDVWPSNPSGKVVMKLNNGNDESKEAVEAPNPQIASSVSVPSVTNESVEIRVIQPILIGEPTSLAPLVVEKTQKQVEPPKLPVPQTAIRLSLKDDLIKEGSIQSNSEASKVVELTPRTPKLVKTKPTQISHTVVLAQSAELEPVETTVPTITCGPEVPEEMECPAEVDAAAVTHPMAKVTVEKEKKGKVSDKQKNDVTAIAIKDAVPDPLFEFDPPGGKSIASTVDRKTDDLRRKFDFRTSSQSVTAVIELESLSATNIDLTGRLFGLAVQDESVCKVIQNDRTVSLIGNQVGTTLVQIWSTDLGDKPQVIRVNVTQKKGWVQTGREDVKDIKQVVAQNFPRAEVNIVSLNDGGIEVRGTTDSEESAKRILELVRKVYLVPVKDKVAVSK